MKSIRPRGQPIIRSKSCDIYLLDEQHVLKLFHGSVPLEDIQQEATVTHVIHRTGLPVPRVDSGIVVHSDNGRNGLILERVHGEPLLDLYIRSPLKLKRYARLFTALHEKIIQHKSPEDLPTQKQVIRNKIQSAHYFSLSERLVMIDMLNNLPDGNLVCHGDLHPGNIMITDHGPMFLDWKDASRGNPICDIARTTLLLFGDMRKRSLLIMAFQGLNRHFCMKEYRRKTIWDEQEFRQWLILNAAIRILERIPKKEKQSLYRLVKKNLPAD